MCGFAGFVDEYYNKETYDRETILTNMMNTIIHRGPDQAGQFLDENAALGFRRLSIIDLSEAGSQPMYNENKDMVLVFNGEIYNYQEIREELIKEGHIFKSDADSETIIHGYEQWGEKIVDRLRGMFAFAIWDIKNKRMFGARDMFGIKPFYYAQMNDMLFIGSEIKSFIEHPGFIKEFNKEALGNYLSFQFVPTNETFFKGVFCLEPGHYFYYENGKMNITRYFDPYLTGDNKKPLDEVVNDVEKVMKDSVRMHKISDVEVASYLSSGIDSSYLAYLGQVDHTFTVGFDEGKYSEIQDAKEFAESINVSNNAKVITPDEYFAVLSDVQYYMDEPVADPAAIGLYFLSGVASEVTKVVLSGEGADELFGGYNIYREPLEHNSFDKIPMPVRRMMGKFAEYCLPNGVKGRGFLMRHGKTLQERYFANATNIFTEREAKRLLKGDFKPGIQKITKPLYAKVTEKDPVSQMQYIDMHLWLVHDILMKGDKMGMANSVEVRVPFLDKKVFELSRTLPLSYKIQGRRTKTALRMAADKEIRKKTAEKPKLGFPIPIRVWLKEDKYYTIVKDMCTSDTAKKFFDTKILEDMLDKHKNSRHANEKTDYSRKIWAVYIFLVWYERFFGQEKPSYPESKRKMKS